MYVGYNYFIVAALDPSIESAISLLQKRCSVSLRCGTRSFYMLYFKYSVLR